MLASKSNKSHKTVTVVLLALLLVALASVTVNVWSRVGHVESHHPTSPAQPIGPNNQLSWQGMKTNDADVEYLSMKDSDGKVIVSYNVTNKTGTAVTVDAKDIRINDQYEVALAGKSTTVIQPGETRSVELALDLSSQDGITSASDIHKLTTKMYLCQSDNPSNQLTMLPLLILV